MSKAVASLALALALGAGTLVLLGRTLGTFGEAAALGLTGIACIASGQALSGREQTTGAADPQGVEDSRTA